VSEYIIIIIIKNPQVFTILDDEPCSALSIYRKARRKKKGKKKGGEYLQEFTALTCVIPTIGR